MSARDTAGILEDLERARSLEHPHLLPIAVAGGAAGRPSYATPLVGESLRTRLDRVGQLPFLDAVLILRGLATALDHLHGLGFVHGELRPELVVVEETHARLGGCPRACATGVDADLYALGAVGYEMLCGHTAVCPHPMPVNARRPHMPPGLAYLVMRCLADDPAERWTSARDMLQLLVGMVTPPRGHAAAHLVAQAHYLMRQRGSHLLGALERFERAAEIEPDRTAAHAGISEAQALLIVWGYCEGQPRMERAHASAQLALTLDPDCADAHAALGLLELLRSWCWSAAEVHLARARELSNSVAASIRLALFRLLVQRRGEEAIAEARAATVAEPQSALAAGTLGRVLVHSGQTEEGLANLHRAVGLDTPWIHHMHLGWGLGHAARHAEARSTLTAAVDSSERHPWALAELGRVLATHGETAAAQGVVDELETRLRASETPLVQPARIAYVLSALGRTDETLTWIERARDEHDPSLLWLRAPLALDEHVTGDSRLTTIWDRMGLPG